jgi:NAD(P)-dependent dehydrogenase (short-subunit alcohol dehydrogenase family)
MRNLEGLGYDGATVVVTGAASGMGGATARLLHELGAKVHAVDLRQPDLAFERFYPTDLADPAQVDATVAALREAGPIDFLFPCAGVPHVLGPMACMLVNYVGTRQLTEALIPQMPAGGGVAVISSDAGLGWQRSLPPRLELLAIDDPYEARRWMEARPDYIRDGYSVSKEMVIVWVMKRAVPLARERGVRINCTLPCPTDTAFMDQAIPSWDADYMPNYPLPLLKRMATPEEQAWPLILLNSRLNNVVTGAMLYTDQGFVAGMLTGEIDPASAVPKSSKGRLEAG